MQIKFRVLRFFKRSRGSRNSRGAPRRFKKKKNGASWFNTWGRFQAKALTKKATQPFKLWFEAPHRFERHLETSQAIPHWILSLYQTTRKEAAKNLRIVGTLSSFYSLEGVSSSRATGLVTLLGKNMLPIHSPRTEMATSCCSQKAKTWGHGQDQRVLALLFICTFIWYVIYIHIHQ